MATDATDTTFQNDVLDRSKQVPVVVDLWAPWCGPCRQLGPILEDAVEAADGAVALVKINIDENPESAAAFQVQSIPAVFAVRDAQVVDAFIGAQGKDFVDRWVESLLPSAADTALADLLAAGDEASLRAALEIDPANEAGITALAEMLVSDGRAEEALALLARIPETAETRRVAALARLGDDAEPGAEDLAAKLDGLLDRVKTDDAARQEYVDVLELMGPDDPRTASYRKALTSRLY
ncbi:MAG: tetratricopeptide repeat protein [Acidimicrobiia bacterium]